MAHGVICFFAICCVSSLQSMRELRLGRNGAGTKMAGTETGP